MRKRFNIQACIDQAFSRGDDGSHGVLAVVVCDLIELADDVRHFVTSTKTRQRYILIDEVFGS